MFLRFYKLRFIRYLINIRPDKIHLLAFTWLSRTPNVCNSSINACCLGIFLEENSFCLWPNQMKRLSKCWRTSLSVGQSKLSSRPTVISKVSHKLSSSLNGGASASTKVACGFLQSQESIQMLCSLQINRKMVGTSLMCCSICNSKSTNNHTQNSFHFNSFNT